jgi:serine/threonine-protein kinase
MFCTLCGGENAARAKFCASCGGELAPATDALDQKDTVLGLHAGQELEGRYRLERLLGRGATGQVWLAHDKQLDLAVAVKVLNDLLAADPQARAHLREEARLNKPLRHQHIASVDDFEGRGPVAFLVMDYVDGESLAERLARDKTLPESEARRIGLAIAQAL